VFVPGKPLHSKIMFVGKASILPKSGVLESCFTRVGSGLTRKH